MKQGICALCKKETYHLNKHHVSYFPEIIISVCGECHYDIHNNRRDKGLFCPPKEEIYDFYKKEIIYLDNNTIKLIDKIGDVLNFKTRARVVAMLVRNYMEELK